MVESSEIEASANLYSEVFIQAGIDVCTFFRVTSSQNGKAPSIKGNYSPAVYVWTAGKISLLHIEDTPKHVKIAQTIADTRQATALSEAEKL